MNTAKLSVGLKVYRDCVINDSGESGRLLVPYLLSEIKNQLKGNVLDAVLNRVYYNLRMGRIGKKIFGVMSVSIKELIDIGIFTIDKTKGEKRCED